MDGPNFNKLFEKKLRKELSQRYSIKFLDIGSSPLHSVNNAFLEGLKELKNIDLNQFVLDMHFFFKYSSAHREGYKSVAEITDSTVQFVIKHCQTRCLSLAKVLVRIIKESENLKIYCFGKLPSLLGFKGKNGVE